MMAEHDSSEQPLIVLSTVGENDDADGLAGALVEARLAACVSVVGGVRSTYRWQGAIEKDGEQLLVIKTTASRYDQLEARLRELHPYDQPEILALPSVRVEEGYRRWLLAEVASAGADSPEGI